jgi:group I intron endonuclease
LDRKSGIYQIVNRVNGKFYLGSSNDLDHRWSSHRSDLNQNKHTNQHLQRAWNKDGVSNFIFYIIEYCSEELLRQTEQYYLDILSLSPSQCYNITFDASAPWRGKKLSKEHKQKLSEAKIRLHQDGYESPMKGKTHSKETRRKLSLASKGNKHWLGKKHSQETKLKISLSKIGVITGSLHPRSKLTESDVIKIREKIMLGMKYIDIAKEFNVSKSTIGMINTRKVWRHI